jgi:hypothetical protein
MLIAMLLLQTAAADIELQASVRARLLTIQKRGDASLTLRTEPDGGNLVDVRAPKANGRKTLRNVGVTVRAEAHIADPRQNRAGVETTQPN